LQALLPRHTLPIGSPFSLGGSFAGIRRIRPDKFLSVTREIITEESLMMPNLPTVRRHARQVNFFFLAIFLVEIKI
jgi:hypothetical protein